MRAEIENARALRWEGRGRGKLAWYHLRSRTRRQRRARTLETR